MLNVKILKRTAVKRFLAAVIGAIFIFSSIAKMTAMNQLADAITVSRLLPKEASRYLAVFVVAIELALGLALLIPTYHSIAIRASKVVFAVFSAYNLWRVTQFIGVPCSCFGPLFKMHPGVSLIISLLLLFATCFIDASHKVQLPAVSQS